MANPLFHNNTVNINDVWFESHNALSSKFVLN